MCRDLDAQVLTMALGILVAPFASPAEVSPGQAQVLGAAIAAMVILVAIVPLPKFLLGRLTL